MAATRTSLGKLQVQARRVLAANLKAQREQLGLTQEQTAERVGFSLQYTQRIERCIVNVPLDTLVRLAHALGVTPAQLLSDSAAPRRQGPRVR
jgi:transcriptional regulator with XRE-family HTH domain